MNLDSAQQYLLAERREAKQAVLDRVLVDERFSQLTHEELNALRREKLTETSDGRNYQATENSYS